MHHGLNADEVLALQDIGSFYCELARIDFCIDTENLAHRTNQTESIELAAII